MTRSFRLPATWPLPADAAAASRLIGQFSQDGGRWARRDAGKKLLAAIGGNSPYLSDLARREAATLARFAEAGPAPVMRGLMAELASVRADQPRATIGAVLRRAKRQVALVVALADLGEIWGLAEVTAALSDFAEAALRLAVDHLLLDAAKNATLRLADPARPSRGAGFTVLGMGKLGGRELNYSSDIDLVLLHDPTLHSYHGEGVAAQFARLARALVGLMETRDAEGYVFRTDLRLRPDPSATPPSVSLAAAIAYYESFGQNWERAAMLKARPVAGDLALGQGFLDAIRPFIWRRGVDFALIADIAAMRRRIEAEQRAVRRIDDPIIRFAGYHLKLGPGGIREIEFLVQTLQLVWGGREPQLRAPATLAALPLLARAGHLPEPAAATLANAYRFLRRTEHRLQMVSDRQTHSLPMHGPELGRFAIFMGFADVRAFLATLARHLDAVARQYAAFFETVPETAPSATGFDFRGPETPARTLEALAALGFSRPETIAETIRAWQAGRIRALRSERAREMLAEIQPLLLAVFARQLDPDAAFARFAAFLERLPAGVQIFALFQRNPQLIARIAAILGAAPALADYLANAPAAIEGLLELPEPVPPRRLLAERLHDAADLEDAIAITRRLVREENFRLATALMEGRMDVDRAGRERSALADAALAALLARVLADHARRFGLVPGGSLAVVLLGKAGSREMMTGSDLDLMLIYDYPAGVEESVVPRGGTARRLPASQWFLRAAHGFVAALVAPGVDGPLYAVDMRLRPSGNKGPVAVSLAAFIRYHAADAWTWERMALTRARVVAGPARLARRVRAALAGALATAGPPARIRADAAAMRARLREAHPAEGPWDVKYREGGLIEVEFIAQTLQLMHAATHPAIAHPTTRIALSRLAACGLLAPPEAARLIAADRLFRTVQELLRIMLGPRRMASLPGPLAEVLLRAMRPLVPPARRQALDIAGLQAMLEATAASVGALFVCHVGRPDPAMRREDQDEPK